MAYAFGAGTLRVNSVAVGTLQDVSLDVSFNSIPLQGNMAFPVAIARGAGSVKGSARAGEVGLAFMSSITNAVMEPLSEIMALEWVVGKYVPGSGLQGTITYALPNIIITSWKVAGGSDKWLISDISFEAAALTGQAGAQVLTVTET